MIGLKEDVSKRKMYIQMIKYYPHFTTSISEINSQPTIIVHSLCGCNLHCYKCCNYKDIVQYSGKEYWTIEDICDRINKFKDIYNFIVFSGGEFLLNSIEDIRHDLLKIQQICSLPIIVYTNGFFLEKVKTIIDLISGWHLDLKLPYHLLNLTNEEDKQLIIKTLGKTITEEQLQQLCQAVIYNIQSNKGINQIRSVRYPFLSNSAFEENQLWIEQLNKQYNQNVPYEVHSFIDIGKE